MGCSKNLKRNIFLLVRNIIFVIVPFCIVSCGEYRWVNNHKDISYFDIDYNQCQTSAYEKFPPNIIQQQQYSPFAAYNNQLAKQQEYRKTTTRCRTNPYTYTTDCSSVSYDGNSSSIHYIPEYYTVNVDLNKNAQNSEFKRCMNSKGWELKYFN